MKVNSSLNGGGGGSPTSQNSKQEILKTREMQQSRDKGWLRELRVVPEHKCFDSIIVF